MNIFPVVVLIFIAVLVYRGIIEPLKNRPKEAPPVVKLNPPIDLRYKYVKRAFKARKIVPTSLKEQQKIKKAFLKIYPDNLFYDELNEENSITSDKEPVAQSRLERPIDLRHIYKKSIWGYRVQEAASASEQRQIKKCILMVFPDNMFYDQLQDGNSVKIKKKTKKHRSGASSFGFWDVVAMGAMLDYLSDNDRDDDFDQDDDVDSDGDYDDPGDDPGDDSGGDFGDDVGSDGGFDDD